ncbi:MAG: response regulator [Acidobacteriota bacterium]
MGYEALVIEDDHVVADVLRMRLQHDGHRVTVAPTQREAYHLLDQQQFDFALLDLRLPTHDGDMYPHTQVGFDTLAHIRDRFAPNQLPVIVMTAYEESSQTAVRALTSGANDYITKPFQDSPVPLDDKLAAITRAIGESSTHESTTGKHQILFTNGTVLISGIEVGPPRFAKLLWLLASRTLMSSRGIADDDTRRMTGKEIAKTVSVQEATVRKQVSEFRKWIAREYESRGLGAVEQHEIIRNTRDWKGYDLNFETCYVVRR